MTLPLRFALRELRGGLRGFYVLIACIALGVMAIAGVGSVASGLADGLAREGRVILGGDVAFSLSLREAAAQERAFLERQGRVSIAGTLRAMARTADGRSALVELKAVDDAYPLYGKVALAPPQPLADALALRDGAFGAAADPALLVRLALAPGARITLGGAAIEIRATLQSEPDKLAGGIGFGPRLLVSEAALRASGLLQPGSVVRWHYRLRLADNDAGDGAVRAVTSAAQAELPEAGWEVRSRSNASPALERNVERFTQYLTLVGLTALLVGGVGVANAVRSHLDRRRDVIATLKSLGATGGRVFAIYLTQVITLAAIGAIPGLAIGAALPFLIVRGFSAMLPLPLAPALYPGDLALALLYGLATALTFAIWPLGRAHDIPASALFRDAVAGEPQRPRRGYVIATVVAAAALAALAIALAYDRRIAAINTAAAGIMAGDFDRRIPVSSTGDEIDDLARNLNRMLDRIEELMSALREVSDNIAHDLKTPLTRLRNRAEAALRDPSGATAARDGLERTIEEADGLIQTFNALLLIARLEAGAVESSKTDADLAEIVADVVDLYQPVADEAGLSIALDVNGPVRASVNRQLFGQAVANLVDNAIKYSRTGGTYGPITVAVHSTGSGAAEIVVGDHGPGIPEADRGRVLKRFVRLEKSRSMPGTGLGLSLVAAVARLHDGLIRLEDNAPGLRVVMSLGGPRRAQQS